MKVYKVTLLIVDADDIGPSGAREVIENARYPNRCIAPQVMEVETREVAWTDEHPLNRHDTQRAAFDDLFDAEPPTRRGPLTDGAVVALRALSTGPKAVSNKTQRGTVNVRAAEVLIDRGHATRDRGPSSLVAITDAGREALRVMDFKL